MPTWPGYSDPSTANTKFAAGLGPGETLTALAFDGTNLVTILVDPSPAATTIRIHTGISASIGSSFAAPVTAGNICRCCITTGGNLVTIGDGSVNIHSGITSTILSSDSIDIGDFPLDCDFNGRDLCGTDGLGIIVYAGISGDVKQRFTTSDTPRGGITWVSNLYLVAEDTGGGTDDFTEYDHVNGSVSGEVPSSSFNSPGDRARLATFGGTNLISYDSTTDDIYTHPGVAVYAGP